MIPLKDDIPARRLPGFSMALTAAALTWFALGGGWDLAVAAGFVWLFGPSVEDAVGRVSFPVLVALGAGVAALLDPGAAVAGAAATVLAGYALLYPRAHVVALSLVPGWMTVVELPALAVLVMWLPLQALAGGLDPSPLVGAVVGAASVRLLARQPQADYERAPAY